jgi:hypothetical protein
MATIDGFKVMFPMMWSHICRSLGCRIVFGVKLQPRLYCGGGVSAPTTTGGVSRLTQSIQLSLVSRMSSSASPSLRMKASSQLLRSSMVLTKKVWFDIWS